MGKKLLQKYSRSVYQLMSNYQRAAKHDKSMSFATRQNRTERLVEMGRNLHELGYQVPSVRNIKPKHIEVLVAHWQSQQLTIGSIKNRLSDIRYTCDILSRPNVVRPLNSDYGIGSRGTLPPHNRAIHAIALEKITDQHLRCSLALQSLFGLRREECRKIEPHTADTGDFLALKPSWTKGGIFRQIPIKSPQQREWLDKAKALVKPKESLIPKGSTYIQQRHAYDSAARRILKVNNLHGLRHAYAQERYRQLTQCEPPINAKKEAIPPHNDKKARHDIAKELGHSRVEVTKVYLG